METITFYSYKGGTGRSLLLANAARYLALLGKRVVAIDFDFEAPGLHYKLGGALAPNRSGDVVPERGVVDYLLAATRAGKRRPKLSDYLTPVAVPRGTPGKLILMPAGAAPSGAYWQSLTMLLRGDFLTDPEGSGVAACLELKARIADELRADVILIDSQSGITELGGVVTGLLADKVVSLLLDNRESLAGSRAVMRSFGRVARLPGQAAIEQFAVLSRIPEADDGARRRILRFLNEPGQTPSETLSLDRLFVLRVDPELAAVEKVHVGGAESKTESRLYKDYLALFEAIVTTDPELVATTIRRRESAAATRDWLTESSDGHRRRHETPEHTDDAQIEEGVQFGEREKR